MKCDKKWHIGHQCDLKTLPMILVLDEDGSSSIKMPPPTSDSLWDAMVEEILATLSLNSSMVITWANTMKLASRIGQ